MPPASPPRAFIFDLDGTLVDSMPLHFRAYAAALNERGLVLSRERFAEIVGPPARDAIPLFLAAAGRAETSDAEVAAIHQRKKELFEDVLRQFDPERLPAADLFERVRGRFPCALVSSANRRGVSAILSRMRWDGAFAAVVTGDDVARGKPDPEPFAVAAAQIGVAPGDCLAFEDTADGLRSATDAGMRTVDVTDPEQLAAALAAW